MRGQFFKLVSCGLVLAASLCCGVVFAADSQSVPTPQPQAVTAGLKPLSPFRVPFAVDGADAINRATIVISDGVAYMVVDYVAGDSITTVRYKVERQDGPDPGPDPTPPGPDPTPDPEPDPLPPPDQKYMVAFFGESNDLDNGKLTADQMLFFTSLAWRSELEAKGHKFIGALDTNACASGKCSVVPTALKPWYSAVAKAEKPCVAIAPIEGGVPVVHPLPKTSDELYKLIGGK